MTERGYEHYDDEWCNEGIRLRSRPKDSLRYQLECLIGMNEQRLGCHVFGHPPPGQFEDYPALKKPSNTSRVIGQFQGYRIVLMSVLRTENPGNDFRC